MDKDFNTGLRESIETDRVKLTQRRKLLLREMGLADVLNRNLIRKDEEIEKLKAKIAELEYGTKPIVNTSANSSVPPSKNPAGVPHTQAQRTSSGRKTGAENYASAVQTTVKNGQISFEVLRFIAATAQA